MVIKHDVDLSWELCRDGKDNTSHDADGLNDHWFCLSPHFCNCFSSMGMAQISNDQEAFGRRSKLYSSGP